MADSKAEKLVTDLKALNDSLFGTKKLDAVGNVKELDTRNSKEVIFILAKELYKLSERAIDSLKKTTKENLGASCDVPALVRTEIKDMLPALLKEAFANFKKEENPQTALPTESHTLVLERQVAGDEEPEKITHQEWVDVVKKDLRSSVPSDVPIMKTYHHEGAVKMTFKNKENMESAKEALETKYKATAKTSERKKLDPKLTIFDLDSEYACTEELEKKILERNGDIRKLKEEGDMFRVVFLDRKNKNFAVLQVSARIRQSLKEAGDWIHVDLRQHRVRDRYHVLQCFDCQEFGHTSESPHCKERGTSVCYYCAGSHRSDDCQRRRKKETEYIKCINCSKSKNKREQEKCKTHTAADWLCPFYVREKAQVMGRTVGCEESKNYYLQRSKALQKEHGIS